MARTRPAQKGLVVGPAPTRFRRRLRDSKTAVSVISLVIVAGAWELVGRQIPLFLSHPTAILQAASETLIPDVLPAFQTTMTGFAVGFAIAAPLGVLIGLAMGRSRLIDLILAPYMNALYATPRISLIPVLILWFGIDFQLRVTIVVLSAIFPIVINTYVGAKEVDREMLDIGRAFTANQLQQLKTIVIPGSLPFVFAGLRIGLARALGGVVVAEMTASIVGIGRLLINYGRYIQTDKLFVALIMLGVISVVLTAVLIRFQRRVMPWTQSERLL